MNVLYVLDVSNKFSLLIIVIDCSFFRTRDCPKGDNCTYLHKARFEVDLVHYRLGDEFFYGRARVPKVCIFYNRGFCYHQQHCRYLHENNGDENLSVMTNERNRCNNRQASVVIR